MKFLRCLPVSVYRCILALLLFLHFSSATPIPLSSGRYYRDVSFSIGPESIISHYEVKQLPLVTFPLPRSWAGNLPVGGVEAHHSDDEDGNNLSNSNANVNGNGNATLFFWLWEAEGLEGSDDLIIWLQGGPACSSLLGLFKEHGPVLFAGNSTTPTPNPYSWAKLANVLYVDQPVGTGFSYGSPAASDNAADTIAFVHWLGSFFTIFPGLKSKRIHLMGESFAGIYIPYIAQAIQEQEINLGIRITSIGLGDATWGNQAAFTDVVATTFIRKHSHKFGTKMPADVLSVLEKADKDCGFKTVLSQLTYPPSSSITIPGNPENGNYKLKARHKADIPIDTESYSASCPRSSVPPGYNPETCDFNGGTQSPAQVSFLINGTDPNTCYGSCATYDAAFNWFADAQGRCFNPYNIADECGSGLYSDDAYAAYLNLPDVKEAIHAPASIQFESCNAELEFDLSSPDKRVEPPAYGIIPGLLAKGVEVKFWAGSLDYIVIPLGQELGIQNMTWNGAQGFKKPLKESFSDARGNLAGTFGSERGLSVYLFHRAGHRVPQDQPAAAFEFVKTEVVMQKS